MAESSRHSCIKTKRLVLRPIVVSDAPRIALLAGDFDVARMTARVPHPYPVLAAEGWIALQAHARARGEELPFAVALEPDGLIGSCGISPVAGAENAWEIGYWLGKPYWGRGYATEAAAALMDWAGQTLGARCFTAGHFADNPASGAVLRKLGFVNVGSLGLFSLARGGTALSERLVWPADAPPDMALARKPH